MGKKMIAFQVKADAEEGYLKRHHCDVAAIGEREWFSGLSRLLLFNNNDTYHNNENKLKDEWIEWM